MDDTIMANSVRATQGKRVNSSSNLRQGRNSSRGFTMLETFAVMLIIAILVSLLLPSVQSAREKARRTSCQNNLANVGLAIHFYHETFTQYPVQLSGTDGSSVMGADNDRRLSIFVALLPFLGEGPLFDSIQAGAVGETGEEYEMMEMEFGEKQEDSMKIRPVSMQVGRGEVFESMTADPSPGESDIADDSEPVLIVRGGPEPWQIFDAWMTEPPVLRCPSDPGVGRPSMGRTNYAACLGDGMMTSNSGPMKDVNGTFVVDPELAIECDAAMRGVFVPRVITQRGSIKDGQSYTLLLGEICTGLGDRDARTDAVVGPDEATIRDNPRWAERFLDEERRMFWRRDAEVTTAKNPSWARGYRWADGMPLFTSFQTILPPNSPITACEMSDDSSGIFSSSSRHYAGSNVCFADGAVRFISNSIDCGNTSLPTPQRDGEVSGHQRSPYGVWGAMGTRSSGELPTSLPGTQ